MKHASSRELYTYWEERRGKRPAPERVDIEPGAIRGVLSETFILALGEAATGQPFRLAGTRVCALFGRELKGESFIGLWAAASQRAVTDLLTVLAEESVGTVAGVSAVNDSGQPLALELLLLPLGTRRPSLARAIGILAPLHRPTWLGASPIGALTLGSRRHIGAAAERRILPRFLGSGLASSGSGLLPPRLRRGLVVYEGGRSAEPAEANPPL
jgi:hypothetical protein